MSRRARSVRAALALLVLGLLVYLVGPATDPASSPAAPPGPTSSAPATTGRGDAAGLPVVRLAELPAEARRTLALIDRGGPFPYRQDGAVFGNRERRLPAHPSGWYREYTVPTPGEDDRGARRLVTGDGGRELYWTADHYASFATVTP